MSRAKTPKFRRFNQQINCFDWFEGEYDYQAYLKSSGPFTLELGCGKAELLLELARRHPKCKFVGIDIKSDRLWKPGQIALEEKLTNVVFLRANARQLTDIFKPETIEQLWLTFPDPFPKKRASKHRLTHNNFLSIYYDLLIKNGQIHFKTDNRALFDWSIEEIASSNKFEIVQQNGDLHNDPSIPEEAKILTTYEKGFITQGLKINYLLFTKS